MNDTNAKAKRMITGVLNDLQSETNNYVDAINDDAVDWESPTAILSVKCIMEAIMAMNTHMYMDKSDDLPIEEARELAKRLAKYSAIIAVCDKALGIDKEE